MTKADVIDAVEQERIDARIFCEAVKIVLPVLRRLIDGRSFLVRWILRSLVAGLEEYRADKCGVRVADSPTWGG